MINDVCRIKPSLGPYIREACHCPHFAQAYKQGISEDYHGPIGSRLDS